MRFLVDESLPSLLAIRLTELGHDAVSISQLGLAGSPDSIVFDEAQRRTAALITRDLDFANIQHFPLGEHSGIIVIRMPTMITITRLIDEVVTIVSRLDEADIKGSTVIIETDRVRIRRKSK